jgi:RNA polymerase sigma-70 factor (ECF subfamily)
MFFKKKSSFDKDDLESIIAACINNNSQAEKHLIKLYGGFAKSIVSRYIVNAGEKEEVINDGFLKVFKNLSKYDHALSFKTWLRAIFINTAIDSYRKNKNYLYSVEIDDADIVHTDIVDVVSKMSADEILQLVQSLSPACRVVFSLYVIDGYNHREIAEMLDITEGTSKSNLRDARRKLQNNIKNNYPDLYAVYSFNKNKINEV